MQSPDFIAQLLSIVGMDVPRGTKCPFTDSVSAGMPIGQVPMNLRRVAFTLYKEIATLTELREEIERRREAGVVVPEGMAAGLVMSELNCDLFLTFIARCLTPGLIGRMEPGQIASLKHRLMIGTGWDMAWCHSTDHSLFARIALEPDEAPFPSGGD